MAILLQFITGLIFGLGLIVAGMADPAKVLNFLDLAGHWDPSLAFVMAGAIAVTFCGFRLVLRRPGPLFAERFTMPTTRAIDAHVIVGPAIFGIGWGLAGLCPGPALTLLGFGLPSAFLFVAAMAAGMAIARWLDGRAAKQAGNAHTLLRRT
ncbi:conserved membrane hypothetical protein [Hyphomicrobiales bacterium]|nr:conserved membrane hypothetical protein [Hyphomicrobiales bacterium]CAH1695253.1 conserved membrane hypothetical protein [Hyphomicrobiales bacterium]